jgi:hypothetical protein
MAHPVSRTAIGNTPPTEPVIPKAQERVFLYLENPSEVDYRYSFYPGVTMSGPATGQLLKAGERLYLNRERSPWLGNAFFFIAASGTPDLIHEEAAE